MGFLIHTVDDGHNPPHEYLEASTDLTPEVGMALKTESGKLVTAKEADEVSYISMCHRDSPCLEGERIPVIRAGHDIIFETTSQGAPASVNVGDKVKLHTDGLHVTPTVGGCAEVVYKDSDEDGAVMRVRFVTPDAASE